jgi:hypothetical protein
MTGIFHNTVVVANGIVQVLILLWIFLIFVAIGSAAGVFIFLKVDAGWIGQTIAILLAIAGGIGGGTLFVGILKHCLILGQLGENHAEVTESFPNYAGIEQEP